MEVRDQRYDAVYHLVTCADGADSFYSLANNKGRSESMQAAKDQDKRTQDAWAGHPHHVIVDNRNTFEQKIERLISLISTVPGQKGTQVSGGHAGHICFAQCAGVLCGEGHTGQGIQHRFDQ